MARLWLLTTLLLVLNGCNCSGGSADAGTPLPLDGGEAALDAGIDSVVDAGAGATTLADLLPSVGSLEPPFSAETLSYTLVLPNAHIWVGFTPIAADPEHSVIRVAGSTVASGHVSPPVASGIAPVTTQVTVTADTGVVRTYTIELRRSAATYVKASTTHAGALFGSFVALSADGNTLAVGAMGEASSSTGIGGDEVDQSAPSAGAVYIYVRKEGHWSQQAYVKASNTAPNAWFGRSVALSADGNLLAVGAQAEASASTGVNGNQYDTSAPGAGAVYIFSRTGANWSQQAYLKGSTVSAGDGFGWYVSLSTDGSRLAVGALGEGFTTMSTDGKEGLAYIFARSGSSWTQEARLTPPDLPPPNAAARFAIAVSLSGDGASLAVAAQSLKAVYIFGRSGSTWALDKTMKSSGSPDAVALSGDGKTMAVRDLPNLDLPDAGPRGAEVEMLTRGSPTWSYAAYLHSSRTAEFDAFGYPLAISSDGRTVASGAYFDGSGFSGVNGQTSDGGCLSSGAVYVFTEDAGAWSLFAYAKATKPNNNERFGNKLALSADGLSLAVGSRWEGSSASGINNDSDGGVNAAPMAGAVWVF